MSSPQKTVTQNAPDITAPTSAVTVPPIATPPATATGVDAFVTGLGAGTSAGKGAFTGKGNSK